MEALEQIILILTIGAALGVFFTRLYDAWASNPDLSLEERVEKTEQAIEALKTNPVVISKLEDVYDQQPKEGLVKALVDGVHVGAEALAKLDIPGVDPLAESVVQFTLEIKDGTAFVKKAEIEAGDVKKELQPE